MGMDLNYRIPIKSEMINYFYLQGHVDLQTTNHISSNSKKYGKEMRYAINNRKNFLKHLKLFSDQ